MKLRDLDPKLSENGVLRFDCPKCTAERKSSIHAIRVPLHGSHWSAEGDFPDTLTVKPSINAGCWHGSITDGEAK